MFSAIPEERAKAGSRPNTHLRNQIFDPMQLVMLRSHSCLLLFQRNLFKQQKPLPRTSISLFIAAPLTQNGLLKR